MKPDQTSIIPQGVCSQKDYTTSGTSLAVNFWITRVGGLGGRMCKVGPGGMHGSDTDVNRVPASIYATRPMIVVASMLPMAKAPPRTKLIS